MSLRADRRRRVFSEEIAETSLAAGESAGDEHAFVSGDRSSRKALDLREGHCHGALDVRRQCAKPGAEYDRGRWGIAGQMVAKRGGGALGGVGSERPHAA